MAPSIVLGELHGGRQGLTIVDPMVGSGTSIVAARLQGHRAIGFDVDPLAVVIARAWSGDIAEHELRTLGDKTLRAARQYLRKINRSAAYPEKADDETRKFVRFWFDSTSRRQLAALCFAIRQCRNNCSRNLLWCAFSRMIITKSEGVSLAMDVSHSRPHLAYENSPHKPFEKFATAVLRLAKAAPFKQSLRDLPAATILRGDARQLPIATGCADMVITSPPYLNAIDYLRGHRLSLVWMGYSLSALRHIRSDAIGSENALKANTRAVAEEIFSALKLGTDAPPRLKGILAKYLKDMSAAISEVERILKPGGRLIIVVGDSTTKGLFVDTSRIVREIAERGRLKLNDVHRRAIPDNRRYLPPPDSRKAGATLGQRMRTEAVFKFERIA
jgi:SAM-dependent methyltransferase